MDVEYRWHFFVSCDDNPLLGECIHCGLKMTKVQINANLPNAWGICPKHPGERPQVTDHKTLPITREQQIALLKVRADIRLIEAQKLVELACKDLIYLRKYSDIYEKLLEQVSELEHSFDSLQQLDGDRWKHWLWD